MHESFCPRLSEAKALLPLLRAHLVTAAPRFSLPGPLSIDLIPIVEEGLFGYELLPDRETRLFLTIGTNERGVPTLRRTSYGADPASAIRLATVDGTEVVRSGLGVRRIQGRDSCFADWPSTVASLWSQFAVPPSDRARHHVLVNEGAHRFLDAALDRAHSHLTAWDPFIRFFGLPKEAQLGFALFDEADGHGELISQRPDMWILRWKCPPHAVYEEWSVTLPDRDAASEVTRA